MQWCRKLLHNAEQHKVPKQWLVNLYLICLQVGSEGVLFINLLSSPWNYIWLTCLVLLEQPCPVVVAHHYSG